MSVSSPSGSPAQGAAFDVAAFLDRRGIGRFHVMLVALSCAITFFEGLDFLLIAYTIPYIRDELLLDEVAIGTILSAGVAGQMCGALVFANIADRVGRRPVILLCAMAAAALTFLTGFAGSTVMLAVLRFLGGFAIGGLLPVAWALNIESMPNGRQATTVALVMFGFSLGSSAAAPLTNALAPAYGWEAVYQMAGAGTLLLALLLVAVLPESVRYMVATGQPRARIAKVLARIAPDRDFAAEGAFVLGDEGAQRRKMSLRAILRALFDGPLALITPLVWAAYFCSSIAIYLNSNLGAVYLEELGMARQLAANVLAIGGIGGALAGIVLLRFTEARGPQWIALFPLAALPCLLAIGLDLTEGAPFVALVLLATIFIGGGHAAVISIASLYYPSSIRSNAGGVASFVAKIGAVIAPAIGAAFLHSRSGVLQSYLLSAVSMLGIAVAVLLLARRVRLRRERILRDGERMPAEQPA